MKYIQTLKNLEKLTNNAPELVDHNVSSEIEEYSYQDKNIHFSILIYEDFVKNMNVTIDCNGISADLYYEMVDGEWVLDANVSSKQKIVTALNREIKDILSQIKEGEYTPVAQEEEVSEVEKILNKMKEMTDDIKYHNEEQEVFNKAYEVILNNLDKAAYVNPDKFPEVKYEKVYVRLGNEDNISIEITFKEEDYIFIVYSDYSENKQYESLSYYPGYRYYKDETIRDHYRDRFSIENNTENMIEVLDKLLNEEEKKAEQLSETDNSQPLQTNQDNYTLSYDSMEEECNQEIENILNEFTLENELVQITKEIVLNDIDRCIYTPNAGLKVLEYCNNEFNCTFSIDDQNNKKIFHIYFIDNKRSIDVRNDFLGNIFIEGGDIYFSQYNAIEKLQAFKESEKDESSKINFIQRQRMIKSEAIEEAIADFIFKVKDGELLRNTDCFYEALKSHNINWVIECLNYNSCEITCLVPDKKERFVIELGYDETDYYSETIDRIDYHVERTLEV